MTLCSGYVQVCNTFSFIFIKLAFPDPTRKWKNYNQIFFFSKYQVVDSFTWPQAVVEQHGPWSP